MTILPVVALLAAGYFLLKGGKPSAASEAPKDANDMLAIVLAPSMTSLDQLVDFYNRFALAAGNAQTPQANLRLNQYALVTALKIAFLRKGAQPDAAELMRIAYAPSSGMGGIQQLPDVGTDRQQAEYAAIQSNDANTIGAYLSALKQAFNSTAAQKGRLTMYALALKAKQMMLQAGINFPDNRCYFAIANAPANSDVAPNSILNF